MYISLAHMCLLYLFMCAGNWQEEIQKYISPDELPQAYGGNRCEPDPLCTNYVSREMQWYMEGFIQLVARVQLAVC